MGWFSKYSYYLVSYTFQGKDDRTFSGNGHMVIKSLGPPTIDTMVEDLERSHDIPRSINLVIVTYHRLNKKEYQALLSKKKKKEDIKIEEEIKI